MIKGSYVAMVTPFNNKAIDYPALEKLIEFQIASGTHGILLCGTTAEAPSYSADERDVLINHAVKVINKRVPVMVGTGSNNIDVTIKNTQKAIDFGADSALVITPYYNKPTQNGMLAYFTEIADNCDIPIVIYNVPGRTSVNMQAATTLKLAEKCTNIVAIKEASGDIGQATQILQNCPDDFTLLSGEDALNYPLLAIGGSGVISVTANVLPAHVSKLVDAVKNDNHALARTLHLNLLDMNQALFIETNPMPVKTMLAMMGFIKEEFRLPLCLMQIATREHVKKIAKLYELI